MLHIQGSKAVRASSGRVSSSTVTYQSCQGELRPRCQLEARSSRSRKVHSQPAGARREARRHSDERGKGDLRERGAWHPTHAPFSPRQKRPTQ